MRIKPRAIPTGGGRRAIVAAPVPWQPLERAVAVPKTAAELVALLDHYKKAYPDFTEAEVLAVVDECAHDEMWKNDQYQVVVRPAALFFDREVVHLSIKRLDKQPCRDWLDFQRIKNQLVGPECDGIELFPAESRLVNTSNQYHLFVIKDPTFRLPFGWNEGRFVTSESGAGAVQRPIDP